MVLVTDNMVDLTDACQNLTIRKKPTDSRTNEILVIEADDLLKIRGKLSELYPNKKFIIAPCMTKLYISREQQVIDADGKTSPDWFYFDTGVLAIVYGASRKDLKITLFQKSSIRLLWYMIWADFVTVQPQTSNFHVLNTNPCFTEHVGFMIENKVVADLILNAINLLSENLTEDVEEILPPQNTELPESKSNKKQSILRTLSLHGRKSKTSKSLDSNTESEDFFAKPHKRRSSLRDSLLRKNAAKKAESPLVEKKIQRKGRSATVIGSRDIDHLLPKQLPDPGYESSPESPTTRDCSSVHTLRLSRADSFRHAVSTKSFESSGNVNKDCTENNNNNSQRKTLERKISKENPDVKERISRTIFRKRRISRSQSLKVISRKRDSQLSQSSQAEVTDGKQTTDSKQHQRAIKLVKPRSSTDSLLLRGETMKSVIETGHVARYARERKQWAKRLEVCSMPSTDLCVTEL